LKHDEQQSAILFWFLLLSIPAGLEVKSLWKEKKQNENIKKSRKNRDFLFYNVLR